MHAPYFTNALRKQRRIDFQRQKLWSNARWKISTFITQNTPKQINQNSLIQLDETEMNYDSNSSYSITSMAILKKFFSTPRFNCDLLCMSTSFFCAICMRVVAHQRGSGHRRGAQWWIIISFSRQAHLRSRVDVVVTVVVARPSVIIKWPVIRAAGLYGTERIIWKRDEAHPRFILASCTTTMSWPLAMPVAAIHAPINLHSGIISYTRKGA